MCIYIYRDIYTYVYVYIYIYTHTYIHICLEGRGRDHQQQLGEIPGRLLPRVVLPEREDFHD